METSLTMKICVLGCLALVAGFGLFLFLKGVGNVRNAIASTHWPKTTGVVVGSEQSQDTTHNRKTGAISTTYATKTTVRYRVNGQEQTTNLIFFGQTFGTSNPTEAELQKLRYPVGAAVSVAYNPHAPGVAAVKPGLHADAFWLPGAGLAFVIPSIMFAIIYLSLDAGLPGFGIGLGIFAGIFTAIGMVMLTGGLVRLWHGHVSQRWPVAPGRIIYSKNNSSTVSTEVTDEVNHTVTHDVQLVYQADLIYEYEVNGQKHYNNQPALVNWPGPAPSGRRRSPTAIQPVPRLWLPISHSIPIWQSWKLVTSGKASPCQPWALHSFFLGWRPLFGESLRSPALNSPRHHPSRFREEAVLRAGDDDESFR